MYKHMYVQGGETKFYNYISDMKMFTLYKCNLPSVRQGDDMQVDVR